MTVTMIDEYNIFSYFHEMITDVKQVFPTLAD